MEEIIKQIPLYQLKEYKEVVSRVLAANKLDILDIGVTYEVIFEDIMGTYTISDIKSINVKPYCCGIKFTVTLINNIEITIKTECQNTMFLKKDIVKKLQSLIDQYQQYINNIIEEKENEEITKKKINELLDKLWQYYDLKQALSNIVEKYNIDPSDVENLVTNIIFELNKMKKMINDKDSYISELEEENIVMRRFINDNDLVNKFIEWYISEMRHVNEEELKEKAKRIVYEDQEDEDDC